MIHRISMPCTVLLELDMVTLMILSVLTVCQVRSMYKWVRWPSAKRTGGGTAQVVDILCTVASLAMMGNADLAQMAFFILPSHRVFNLSC